MNNTFEEDIFELIKQSNNGDKVAKSKIVERNVGLIWSIVKRFTNRGFETEDLFQIGCIGLMKAIKKFDMSYEVQFSTYAVPVILGEIKRFIRDDGIIKVSRSLKEISSRARITMEVMSKELNREPSISEIAERMKVNVDDIILAMEAVATPESIYQSVYEGSGREVFLIDKLAQSSKGIDIEDRIALKEILSNLDNKERQIIFLRYFKEKTQSEVAAMIGVSQVQVSRMEKKILSMMKRKIMES